MDTLDQLQRLADGLYPTSDPDELGRLDRVIRKLNEIKRISLAELDGPVTGSQYRVTEFNSAKRSYNSARIIQAFSERGWDISDLVNTDAVRLSWHWTGLRKAMRDANVTMHVASHEVEDGNLEDAMVGEVWSSRFNIEGIGEK